MSSTRQRMVDALRALDDLDIGDEREVMRALAAAGFRQGDVIVHGDIVIEDLRRLRQHGSCA
jgi:hypothetical protein